jgi:AmiR/NasT family two-component response regulator
VSRHGLTEADAHDRLQRTAMNAGLPLHEVAAQILRDASTSQPRVR